jgi:Flp pilus assembly protein TadB
MIVTYAVIVLAAVTLLHSLTLLRLYRNNRALDRLSARLTHFAEALALLTDTTEAGLTNIAVELESRRKLSRGGSKRETTKRIVSAVRAGLPAREVALRESMSESEIGLHLRLADGTASAAGRED